MTSRRNEAKKGRPKKIEIGEVDFKESLFKEFPKKRVSKPSGDSKKEESPPEELHNILLKPQRYVSDLQNELSIACWIFKIEFIDSERDKLMMAREDLKNLIAMLGRDMTANKFSIHLLRHKIFLNHLSRLGFPNYIGSIVTNKSELDILIQKDLDLMDEQQFKIHQVEFVRYLKKIKRISSKPVQTSAESLRKLLVKSEKNRRFKFNEFFAAVICKYVRKIISDNSSGDINDPKMIHKLESLREYLVAKGVGR